MNKLKTVTLLAAILLAVASQASAVTLEPDFRGDDNSVHAVFDWLGDGYWDTTLFETSQSSYPLSQMAPEASDDGYDTTIQLPNFIDPLSTKLMRIQMFFDGPVSGDLIAIDLVAYDPLQTSWQVVGGSGAIDSNVHFIDIEITPNPDWEVITIYGNDSGNVVPGNLMTIEVDTVSVPEPATLSLLALGGLLIRRRKK